MMRRATFPYVRHDRDDGMPMQPYLQQQMHHQQMLHQHHNHPDNLIHFSPRQEAFYGEPHMMEGPHGEQFIPSVTNSPHAPYHEFDDNANIVMRFYSNIRVATEFGRGEANLRRAVDDLLSMIWNDLPRNIVTYW